MHRRTAAGLITLAVVLSHFTAVGWWQFDEAKGWHFATNDFTVDDFGQVVWNPHCQSAWPPWKFFTLDLWEGVSGAYRYEDFAVATGAYRPLFQLSCALQIQIHGQAAVPLHVANVLLHLVVCLLIWELLGRLGASSETRLIASLLFAVVTIHTEAVASIVGRAELLAALGISAAVFTWLGRGGERPSWSRAAGTSAWFALALFSKEGAVVAPALLLLADWARGSSLRSVAKTLPQWTLCAVPAAAYFGLRWWIFGSPVWTTVPDKLDNPLVEATFSERALASPALLFHYFRLTYVPLVLSSDYSLNALPMVPAPRGPLAAMGLAAALFVAALILMPSQRRALAAGAIGLWLTTALFINWPMLSLLMFAERLFYTPSLFALLPAAAGLAWTWRRQRAVGLGLVLGLLLVYGLRTALRNRDWRNDLALAEKTVLAMPNSARAQGIWASQLLGVADAAEERGRTAEAEQARSIAAEALDRAISIYPGFFPCYALQASILAERGEWERAAELLEFALPNIPLTPGLASLEADVHRHVR